MSVSSITRDQETYVQQRTRLLDARMTLQAIAYDPEVSPEFETKLRLICRDLKVIEDAMGEKYSVRKVRKESSNVAEANAARS